MNANPTLGLVLGLAVANSKGLTGSDATGVALIAAIAPFPMGVVLASILADRETASLSVFRPDTSVPAGTGSGKGKGTWTSKPPTPTPVPGKPPANPVAILGNEFQQLQTAAAELALHESQATIDTELERLVEEIRHAREELDTLNKEALKIDRRAQEETAESAATEKREEAARKRRESGGRSTTANRGS